MIDNRMVKDNHQEGIERVKQKSSERGPKPQSGSMSHGNKNQSSWKRGGESLTQRRG